MKQMASLVHRPTMLNIEKMDNCITPTIIIDTNKNVQKRSYRLKTA